MEEMAVTRRLASQQQQGSSTRALKSDEDDKLNSIFREMVYHLSPFLYERNTPSDI
jgi:hypothetical protein